MTYVLGLTGSIATGKSTVLGMLRDAGIPTYSADQAVHELYSGEAVAAVAEKFPEAIVKGKIDRQKLAQILVAAPHRLSELEAIVHPLVQEKANQFIDFHKKFGSQIVVLEIPLLFESGTRYPMDAIAVTWCSDDVQRQRALARDGMSAEKLDTILARQMPQAEKKRRADFLIDTGCTVPQTQAQIDQMLQDCRQRARAKSNVEAKS